MNASHSKSFGDRNGIAQCQSLYWFGAVFGLVFPAIATWGYFVFAAQFSMPVQQATYLVVKSIQFAFPLAWVCFVLREPLTFRRPESRGLILGAAFSICVVAAGWSLFEMLLREMPMFSAATPKIHEKIVQFGINSPGKYAVLGVFYSLFHSLLEEYYWRWFVFQQLRKFIAVWPAILVSAVGFTAHHVIVLSEFFREAPWLAWLFASAVGIGGAFWAWLYERSGSLYSSWLSHLLIDAGIFWVGYELVREALESA